MKGVSRLQPRQRDSAHPLVLATLTSFLVPFVSDMFAFSRTLVIIMSSFTAGLYILSLFLERWLRHVDRIPGTIHSKQRTFDIVAIVMGIIGAAGLVILSVFNGASRRRWSI